jgi:glycosyltransferase involved in cell wall biosynthesis
MHVLFVTDNRFDKWSSGDGSTRYRCFNVAEAIIAAGHRATVASLPEVMLPYLGRYDVISVLRPRAGARLNKLIRTARNAGIHLVADFDDLIFDVAAASESPLVLNGFADEKTVARGFDRFATAAQWFDEITVSTEPLAHAAHRCFAHLPVHVLANGLSLLWLKHADDRLTDAAIARPAQVPALTLSYLPGTRSHDADFRSIQSQVAQWLARDSARRLRIVGELTIDEAIVPVQQLAVESLVPFFQLPEKIQRADVTLAPLVNNKFNHAKSHIKFLESAAFGVPVVATASADIKQHDPLPGLFCPVSACGWPEAIESATAFADDANACVQLMRYARERWTSVQTSASALERWLKFTTSRADAARFDDAAQLLEQPDSFYLSLRPVPRLYTRHGWRPDGYTHLIVFDADGSSDAALPDALEERVSRRTSDAGQWLLLVHRDAPQPLRDQWCEQLRQCMPHASHIEVLHAATPADRCALIYQCDHAIWLAGRGCPTEVSIQRSETLVEAWQRSYDRWCRKGRKFRESPGRFFADSRIAQRRLSNR